MKLYSSAAFRILGPQGMQTRFNKFWFRDKGNPIDPLQSAKISSTLSSCLHQGKSKFTKDTLAPPDVRLVPQFSAVVIVAVLSRAFYLITSNVYLITSLQGFVEVDIPC